MGLSGGDLVLADESTEDFSSADPVLGEVDFRWPGVSLSRCELAERTVSPPASARTISALLALRNHVIAPILAGVRSPRMGRKPKIWNAVDRDYETLRIGMQTLFQHVGIETQSAAV